MSERDRELSSVLGDEERPAPAAPQASTEIAPAGQETKAAEPQSTPAEERVTYSMSPGLPGFLGAQRIALAVSSYQSGKFYLLGQNVDGGLLVDERFFRKAMGICVPDKDTILLATLFQIVRFKNVLNQGEQINNVFDACYVPRETYVTGEIDAHDVGVLKDGRVVFVNTLYNCLATPSERHSFAPLWKPPFISAIVKEDRCHLNGLAMADGVPRYVTAVSRSDTIDGWRDRRASGGVVVDVQSGEIVIGGLSMPHSPRIYRDRLWLLNSGTGELGWIEPGAGRRRQIPRARLLPRLPARARLPRQPRLRRAVEAALPALRGTGARSEARGRRFRALVRRAGDRSQQRRLRALVPPRRRGGGALRPRDRARRDAADGARFRQQRNPRADHARSARRRRAAELSRATAGL